MFKISFLTKYSTSGDSNINARRVYTCATGKYRPNHGNNNCSWKIILKRNHESKFWYMHNVTQEKCTCFPPRDGIDLLTLINLPGFHSQVRNNLYGNKTMTMNNKQLLQQVPIQHHIEKMDLKRFAKAQRAVSQYLQTEVLKQDFQEFPVFLDLLV